MKKYLDKNSIISTVIMIVVGLAVVCADNAYLVSAQDAKDAAIRALIGDAIVVTGEGSADGFAGPVTAKVSYADGVIVDLVLSGDAETPDIGGAAMTALKQQILEKHTYEGVDAVSGATYTSNGVMSAVKQAMGIVEIVKTDEEVFEELAPTMLAGASAVEGSLLDDVLVAKKDANGNYLFMVQGVGHYPDHPFKVAVLVDANGCVADIELIYSHETDGFGSEVLNENYWSQYMGAAQITRKSGTEATKIDTVSGATETSVGLYNGVKAALLQFAEFNK